MKKKTARRIWRVVCVLGNGQTSGDCGHGHRTKMAAARCHYEPRAYKRDLSAELLLIAAAGASR